MKTFYDKKTKNRIEVFHTRFDFVNWMLTIEYRSFSCLYIQLKHNTVKRKNEEENIWNRGQETGEINKSRLQQHKENHLYF